MKSDDIAVSAYAPTHRPGWILRYTFAERINHWFGALTYCYLLLTGLAFWSPYLFWMADIVGGGPTARFWHPWVGILFTISTFIMFDHWGVQMLTSPEDRAWWKSIGAYIRNEDQSLPPVGKFNFGQKLWFWLIFYGVILLLLSGIGLWFTESIAWSLRFLRYAAILIHVSAALLTIGGFLIHVYMSTLLEEGSFNSMVEGDVSPAWAKEFHELWYEQVTREKPPRK
jgi:formate dehydrogenase subunit gamma